MLKRTHNQRDIRKGSSTTEYIMVIAAIISLVIVFLGPSGTFIHSFNMALQSGTSGMQNMSERLSSSRPILATPNLTQTSASQQQPTIGSLTPGGFGPVIFGPRP